MRGIVGESDALLETFAAAHPRCACCWITHREAEATGFLGLQTHHLVKRSRCRCDAHWNLLRLCERCHRCAEGERVEGSSVLTMGSALWLKFCADPAGWRPRLLAEIYGRRLPDLEATPRWAIRERERRQPVNDWRNL